MATAQELEVRKMKGQTIAQVESNIRRIDATEYRVKSQSGHGEYQVISTEAGWYCSCPDAINRSLTCKHIFAVELSLELRRRIENAKRIVPLDYQSCLSCGSQNVVKHGLLHNKSGDIQRYSCKACGKRYTLNLGFERMRATPQAITGAMQLYFSGESLRNVQRFLKLQGVTVCHVTVYRWIAKYVKLMNEYLDKVQPDVGKTWRADELFIKVKGNMKYLFAMMDDESRYWIAQQVADAKGTSDVRPMFIKAKEIVGRRPETFISDGAHNFMDAYKKEFWTHHMDKTKHVRHIRFQGDLNNNKMERMNGEVRDREKVLRGLKKSDTPILKGYQIYHNFVRPHEGLDGKTPGRGRWNQGRGAQQVANDNPERGSCPDL